MIQLRITTKVGALVVEIYEDRAPQTAEHFLRYVDKGYYNGATFYRTLRSPENQPNNAIKIDLIEGGFYNDYYENAMKTDLINGRPYDESRGRKGPHPLILLERTDETGIKHLDGTISLGRTSPDSVDDAFIICVGDQPELDAGGKRHPDGLGFPAFGKVVKGMDVVRQIHGMEAEGQKIISEVEIISIARE